MFSWVLHDKENDRLIAARDPIGVTTFYMGRSSDIPNAVYFASELKCLYPVCDDIQTFPPGHVYDSKINKLIRYYDPKWLVEPSNIPTNPLDLRELRKSFEQSVRKRMMAEVPFGVLLSGGLDSSLVASIAQRETIRLNEETRKRAAEHKVNTNGALTNPRDLVGIDAEGELQTDLILGQLNSFSIGLPTAPDAIAAKEAIEDQRAKGEQDRSGGALYVRPQSSANNLLTIIAIYQCFFLRQLLLPIAMLMGSRCNNICILAQ